MIQNLKEALRLAESVRDSIHEAKGGFTTAVKLCELLSHLTSSFPDPESDSRRESSLEQWWFKELESIEGSLTTFTQDQYRAIKVARDTLRFFLTPPSVSSEHLIYEDGSPGPAATHKLGKDERQLRRLLAMCVAMPGMYYDDGEANGSQHGIGIDFMREPVADIQAKLHALNVARFEHLRNSSNASASDSSQSPTEESLLREALDQLEFFDACFPSKSVSDLLTRMRQYLQTSF